MPTTRRSGSATASGLELRWRAEHLRAAAAGLLPGRRWVDWVGTSFYSRFPNFTGLERFYKDFAVRRNKPFAIAEWAIWGADAPSFADRLFDWIGSHRRTRMVHYNQGSQPGGIFRLSRYPASARVVKRRLASPRYVGFAPEQH